MWLLREHKKTILLTGLALLLAILGAWFYKNLTWKEKEIDRGYSKAALKNDFLAAEFFLRKQGMQVTTVKNFTLLDTFSWRNISLGDKDTIILINGHKTLAQPRYDHVMEWVENGGTLITSTQNPFIGDHTDAYDLLLDNFNIEPVPEVDAKDERNTLEKLADELENINSKNNPEEQPIDSAKNEQQDNEKNTSTPNKKSTLDKKSKPADYFRCHHQEEPTQIDFHGEEKPLAFDFSQSQPFQYKNTAGKISNENDAQQSSLNEAMHLAYFDIGEGAVTITSDNMLWENKRLDCYDHAFALWRLINPEGRVWFLINQDAPSLWSILWRAATYGIIASLLALALWLWASAARFGPTLSYEQQGRRSLAEHIYASAMLLWRKQQHPQLLTRLRKDIISILEEQHPLFAQGSLVEKLRYLHQLSSIPENSIEKALFTPGLYHPQEFTAAIACLQNLRKII